MHHDYKNHWRLALATAPTVEPVTLAEAKAYLGLETAYTNDDSFITSLITVCRQLAETEIKRAIVTQTWDLFSDSWPHTLHPEIMSAHHSWLGGGGNHTIYLPLPDLQSVSFVKYYDVSGTQQTLDTSLYQVTPGAPGRVRPAPFQVWPLTQWGLLEAVQIRFVCGYGDNTATPECIKLGIKLFLSQCYEVRIMPEGMPDGIRMILNPEWYAGVQ